MPPAGWLRFWEIERVDTEHREDRQHLSEEAVRYGDNKPAKRSTPS